MKRGVCASVTVLALASLMLTGCFGKFTLVRGLYDFNKQVEDKFIRSVVFDVMVILPVYSIAGLVDWAVLNVIEFWTGKNPVVIKITELDGERFVQTLSRAADGGVRMRVDRYRGAMLVDTLVVSNDHEAGRVTAERTIAASGERERLLVQERDGGATVVRMGEASSVPSIATASADDVLNITRRVEWLRERAMIALGHGGRGLQPAPG